MSNLRVPDLNRIFVAGRLTRDPDLRYLSNGTAVCKLGLANSRYYKAKDGTRAEETVFVDVTVWDKQAEWMGEQLSKGRPVLVEGRLKMDEWEDKTTGQKRSRLEIVAQRVTPLDWDDEQGHETQSQVQAPQAQKHNGGFCEPVAEEPIPQDDIPF